LILDWRFREYYVDLLVKLAELYALGHSQIDGRHNVILSWR